MSSLFKTLKRFFYFSAASYFAFFARFVLRRSKPIIILVTGSSGKTTLLHLIESELKDDALYSHHANSAFGVPFHILGLKRTSYSLYEWPLLFLAAPFRMFKKINAPYYVVEADAERPHEAEFISSLLHPDIVIWLSLGQAHGASYDLMVKQGIFQTIFDAMAYEYGYTVAFAKRLVIANADNEYIVKQMSRSSVLKELIRKDQSWNFKPSASSTGFEIGSKKYIVPALVPRDTAYAISAVRILMDYLKRPMDTTFSGFILPPGRSSVFEGIKNITIIDSTYNATSEGVKVMLDVLKNYPGNSKWLVLGDMLEQGVNESVEHGKLAESIKVSGATHIILVGPRLKAHTYPLLTNSFDKDHIACFEMPAPALKYIKENMRGGEVILFKGARFLEGIVEPLLLHTEDAAKLCRREAVWVKRRKQWGLPK